MMVQVRWLLQLGPPLRIPTRSSHTNRHLPRQLALVDAASNVKSPLLWKRLSWKPNHACSTLTSSKYEPIKSVFSQPPPNWQVNLKTSSFKLVKGCRIRYWLAHGYVSFYFLYLFTSPSLLNLALFMSSNVAPAAGQSVPEIFFSYIYRPILSVFLVFDRPSTTHLFCSAKNCAIYIRTYISKLSEPYIYWHFGGSVRQRWSFHAWAYSFCILWSPWFFFDEFGRVRNEKPTDRRAVLRPAYLSKWRYALSQLIFIKSFNLQSSHTAEIPDQGKYAQMIPR